VLGFGKSLWGVDVMTGKVIAGALASAVALLSTEASANVILVSFTANPSTISAGGQTTLDVTFSLSADPNFTGTFNGLPDYYSYSNPYFVSGSIDLYSGDGQVSVLPIGLGASATFTYASPGTYTPSFSISGEYSESGQVNYYTGSTGVDCGFFGCTYYPIYATEYFTSNQFFNFGGDGSVVVVPAFNPVPGPIAGAGLPGLIFAGGGLLGWWRRKRPAQAAA
jgi:hypothetical protein